jgi:hypothetical protein
MLAVGKPQLEGFEGLPSEPFPDHVRVHVPPRFSSEIAATNRLYQTRFGRESAPAKKWPVLEHQPGKLGTIARLVKIPGPPGRI